ncbi:MAG: Rrf2 family transcriptional regulator [Spirochaetes bacterium]|nr:Rrf2 family transcriptional regulator [Spirochaetota bacterium]
MKLSTKARYAVRSLLDLALNYKGRPVQIKEIAERQDVSVRYLENLFTKLRANGILVSEKGKGGGFLLARPSEEIKLLDVISTVEGDLSLVNCVKSPSQCKRSSSCVMKDLWADLSQAMIRSLKSKTLKDLVKDYHTKISKQTA